MFLIPTILGSVALEVLAPQGGMVFLRTQQ